MNAGTDIQVESTTVNRQWVLAERPVDRAVRETDFRLVESPLPVPGDGEFLVRTLYLSLAPVMRLYMIDGAGIERPLGIGEVMRGRGVGQVIASNHAGLSRLAISCRASSAGRSTRSATARRTS